jgi:hypothetical protein
MERMRLACTCTHACALANQELHCPPTMLSLVHADRLAHVCGHPLPCGGSEIEPLLAYSDASCAMAPAPCSALKKPLGPVWIAICPLSVSSSINCLCRAAENGSLRGEADELLLPAAEYPLEDDEAPE